MITDKEQKYRELGIRRIIKARKEKTKEVRAFHLPKINFDAKHYSEMIFWNEVSVSEPPITANIEMLLTKALDLTFSYLPKCPCQSKSVGRCVRLVSEASLAVCRQENRDGFIQLVYSRQICCQRRV